MKNLIKPWNKCLTKKLNIIPNSMLIINTMNEKSWPKRVSNERTKLNKKYFPLDSKACQPLNDWKLKN